MHYENIKEEKEDEDDDEEEQEDFRQNKLTQYMYTYLNSVFGRPPITQQNVPQNMDTARFVFSKWAWPLPILIHLLPFHKPEPNH